MKVSYSKGLQAAGLIFLTFQMLVHLFNYIVNSISILNFAFDNWTCILGYLILGVLFLRKEKVTTDFILTIIGVMFWVAKFLDVFGECTDGVAMAFAFCACGILGVILVLIALAFDIRAEKLNENEK